MNGTDQEEIRTGKNVLYSSVVPYKNDCNHFAMISDGNSREFE